MSNSSSSPLIITINDSRSYARLSITDGVATEIGAGGIPTDYVLRKGDANLIGTPEEIRSEVERAFNYNGSDYVATLEDSLLATIFETGNGLPLVGALVYHPDSNRVFRVATASNIRTHAPGKGNSIIATLIPAGSADDYSDEGFKAIVECRVDLDEDIDYSEYTVHISNKAEYYGTSCTDEDAERIAEALGDLIEKQFPNIETSIWNEGYGSSSITGPNQDTINKINEWIAENWQAAL